MDTCVERIVLLLQEKGVSNKALADYLEIPPSVISDWKIGRANSYNKYIGGISEFFGVSADYVLGRTPIRTGYKWDDLITQYRLCETDKQLMVDRLLGITHSIHDNSLSFCKVDEEEDMSTIMELVSMFEKLSLVGKSRVIAVAADELDKIK